MLGVLVFGVGFNTSTLLMKLNGVDNVRVVIQTICLISSFPACVGFYQVLCCM